MARPSVVVVCTNIAQAGRLAQGLGTHQGHQETRHHHDRSGSHGAMTARGTRARGATEARGSTTERTWKVFDGKTLFEVKDLGTRLEARSEEDGSVVWTGVRIPSGWYETRFTTLPEPKRASFLQKVHDGDQTTPGARQAPASTPRAAPASGPRAVKKPVATAKHKAAAKAHPVAPRAEPSVAAPKKRGRPAKAKPAASPAPKSKAPVSVKPKSKAPAGVKPKPTSKAPASAKPKSKAPASAARPKAQKPAKAKTKAKPQHAPSAAANGPPTSRSPASARVTPASMRRQLHAKDPETPEAALATLEDIWRGGASEPARAWMIAKGFTDLADAYIDWVEHHTIEANGYMQAARALRSA
jgi:hypothetical protein